MFPWTHTPGRLCYVSPSPVPGLQHLLRLFLQAVGVRSSDGLPRISGVGAEGGEAQVCGA